jgi:drug/metabolite transporter (DMT)-like permease
MSINKKQANLMLLAVAILWGSSYVFAKLTVQAGMHSGLINACRGTMCVIAGYLLFFKKINKINRKDIKLGLLMGTINFLGYHLTQAAPAQDLLCHHPGHHRHGDHHQRHQRRTALPVR